MHLMLNFFRKYRWQTLLMLLALFLSGLAEGVGLSALLPLLNVAIKSGSGNELGSQNPFEQYVVEFLANVGIEPTIGPLLVIVVIGVALKSLLLLVAQRQVGYTAAQIGTDLRLEMLRAMLRSRWEYFLNKPIGQLTNAMATEAQRSSDSFVCGATAITFLIQALIYGCVAVAVSWRAALLSLGAGLLVIGVSHFLVMITRKAGKKQTHLMNSLMSRLTDTLQSVKPLKAMAREHLADSVLAMETSRLNKSLRRQVFSKALLNSVQEVMFTVFIALGMYVALVTYAMEFATVMVLVVTLGRSFSFVGKVQKQYQSMVQSESAYWSIQKSINEATTSREHLDAGVVPRLTDSIEFRNVGFAYDGNKVFSDVSLEIPVGGITALIGPSGVGKTTIIDLTIALLKPTSGEILVAGTPLGKLDIRAWRQSIGYVPQETVLLHDTVLHNVTLGESGLTEGDAERALRQAGAWAFVSSLPEGLHTVVGERGGKLSGGQRQRIAIARALIKRPQLLILDEATSALDPVSEREVCETMAQLKAELTILAVSHDTAIVDAADRIYELGREGATLVSREELASKAH
ncbi:ABC transporter ATP-binding protein [Porticoccus sp.]